MPVARWLLLFACLLTSGLYGQETARPAADDPALEKRVLGIASELRCLVCQNQTLADSNAPLALDLRNEVREQLKSGKSERDVVDFMVARYGDFVRYRPALKASTVLLWAGPFLLLALGLLLLFLRIGRKAPVPELSAEERQQATRLLE
jgi:cytochrome c-type biogenesis protein CcmH